MLDLRALIKCHICATPKQSYHAGGVDISADILFTKPAMPTCRPEIHMPWSAFPWLAIALTAQLALSGAQHRDEYAVVLSDPPVSRRMAHRSELRSARALDFASKIRRAQTSVRGL